MNILLYADNLERAIFFDRLADGMHKHALAKSCFVTSRLSVYFYLKKKGLDVHWVRRNTGGPSLDVTNTRQVLEGQLSPRKASVFASSLWCAIDSIHSRRNIDLIIDWNGTGIEGPVIRQFSKERGIKTLFLEIANLPGKIFADPLGTNAQSLLAQCPAILDSFTPNTDEYEKWRATYLREKKAKHVVPQSKQKTWMKVPCGVDWIGHLICRRPLPESFYVLIRKILRRFTTSAARWNFSDHLPPRDTFVLYPMQVSNDSQLLIHSNMTNHQGIRQAHEIAKKHGCQLVVKPHPAEFEKGVIAGIHELRKELEFLLTNENTFHLIDQSRCVVTVNSTVGLESLLVGKKVHFLADGVLPSLNSTPRLAQYVLGYLVEADYFGRDPLPRKSLVALLETSSLEYGDKRLPCNNLAENQGKSIVCDRNQEASSKSRYPRKAC